MKFLFGFLICFSNSMSIAIEIPDTYNGKDVVSIFDNLEIIEGENIEAYSTDGFGYFQILRIGTETFQLSFKVRESRNSQLDGAGDLRTYAESFFPDLGDDVVETDVSAAFEHNIRLRFILSFSNLFMVTELDGNIHKSSHFIVVTCKSDQLRFLRDLANDYVNAIKSKNIEWRAFRRSKGQNSG